MGRNGFAYTAGFILTLIVIYAVAQIGYVLFPLPGNDAVDSASTEAFSSYVGSLPTENLLTLAASWWCGAFFGSLLAIRTGTQAPWIFAATISGVVFGYGVFTIIVVPSPTWFIASALGGICIVAVAATFIGGAIRPERPWIASSE